MVVRLRVLRNQHSRRRVGLNSHHLHVVSVFINCLLYFGTRPSTEMCAEIVVSLAMHWSLSVRLSVRPPACLHVCLLVLNLLFSNTSPLMH